MSKKSNKQEFHTLIRTLKKQNRLLKKLLDARTGCVYEITHKALFDEMPKLVCACALHPDVPHSIIVIGDDEFLIKRAEEAIGKGENILYTECCPSDSFSENETPYDRVDFLCDMGTYLEIHSLVSDVMDGIKEGKFPFAYCEANQ